MAKTERVLHLKRFLKHYRSGRSEEELRQIHRLSRRGLHKVLEVAVNRGLLTTAELRPEHRISILHDEQGEVSTGPLIVDTSGPITEDRPGAGSTTGEPTPPLTEHSFPTPPPAPVKEESSGDSLCPQCNAQVGLRALICPECGHVLPGQQRWEEVEPRRRFVDRVPPAVWGTILAIPIAILLFFFFRDLMIPSAEKRIDERIEALRKSKRATTSQGAPVGTTNTQQVHPQRLKELQVLVKRLIREERLSSVNGDFTKFTTGSRWEELTVKERSKLLAHIRDSMKKANLEDGFDVVDPWGGQIAIVRGKSIQMITSPEQIQPAPQQVPQEPPAGR